MPHYEEKKALIAKRVQERKKQRELEEEPLQIEYAPEEEESVIDRVLNAVVEDEVLDEIVDAEYEDEAEAEEGLLPIENIFEETFQEAYAAYCEGVDFDDNPFITGDMSEDEDDPDVVLSVAWQDGWINAHTDACIANLILTARKMTVTEDDGEIISLFDDLSEAVEVLGEVLDFDNYQEHWGNIIG